MTAQLTQHLAIFQKGTIMTFLMTFEFFKWRLTTAYKLTTPFPLRYLTWAVLGQSR